MTCPRCGRRKSASMGCPEKCKEPRSATDELFELLASISATPTLYGRPVTAAEAKEYAARSFTQRIAQRAEPQWRPFDPCKENANED